MLLTMNATRRSVSAASIGFCLVVVASGAIAQTAPAGDIGRYHPTLGTAAARVDVVWFADLQCPFSARLERTLTALRASRGDDVRIVLVHRPLAFHRHAKGAAIASLAALRQDAFWPMVSRMFAAQRDLGAASLLQHARALGLDLKRFGRDLADPALLAKVEQDAAIGDQLRVSGTPTVFVNGLKLVGAGHADALVAMVSSEISAAAVRGRRGNTWIRGITFRRAAKLVRALYDGRPDGGPSTALIDIVQGRAHGATAYQVPVEPDDPIFGDSAAARATVVVFCRYAERRCVRIDHAARDVLERFGRRVRVVWRQAPLRYHPSGEAVAAGALCAARQGGFVDIHRGLLSTRGRPELGDLLGYAIAAGLDLGLLRDCIASDGPKRLRADVNAARMLGVTAAPAVFVNGVRVPDATASMALVHAVEAALEHASGRATPDEDANVVYKRLQKDAQVPYPEKSRRYVRLPRVPRIIR